MMALSPFSLALGILHVLIISCWHTAQVDGVKSAATIDEQIFSASAGRPNFILIQTDDEARWDMIAMNKTARLLRDQGATLNNYMVNTPVCCPSRTEIFSGRYYHNIGAPNGSCMHVNSKQWVFDDTSLFSTLQSNGYLTGVFGKVTNDQGGYFCKEKMDAGMTMISSPCDYNSFYSSQYFVKLANGTKYVEKLNPKLPTTYQTSQLGNRSISWIKDIVKTDPGKPFLAYIGPHAPHYPASPAPWYQGNNIFENIKAPRTPNWNVSCPDKHPAISSNPPLNAEATLYLDHNNQVRLLSLLSVDDIIDAVYSTLKDLDLLQNTYIIFTSDHGYHLGQWRVPSSKLLPYDTDIFVSTFIRGPGIEAGSKVDAVVGNVDIAPTILDLAGIAVPKGMDGKSMAGHLLAQHGTGAELPKTEWREAFLIEFKSAGRLDNSHTVEWWPGEDFIGVLRKSPAAPCKNCAHWWIDGPSNTYRALRLINATHNIMYAEFNADWQFDNQTAVFHEYYDITEDPYQMKNTYSKISSSLQMSLHEQLHTYAMCAGGQENGNCP
ncbi:extracellular sulfatase Sulf-1-like [Sycon ciliatum]|uniref:extracellular sulfatase Sulf-1-like n=1 Tax=Sycon ciliatum TaxID=27933 RepID=UPI0031F62D9B